MTPSEATTLLATLKAAYPRQHIDQATIIVYAGDLQDLDSQQAAQAVANIRRSSRWFPTISEIRETCAEIQLDAPKRMEAWRQASQKTTRHPLVDQARRTVGDDWTWRTGESFTLMRAFEKAYTELRDEALAEIVQPSLPPASSPLQLEPAP